MKRRKWARGLRRLRHKRSYTFDDVARIVGVHVRSVQALRKKGLRILNPGERPSLVMGAEVLRVFDVQKRVGRITLKPFEFRCPRCKASRMSRSPDFWIQSTGRTLGSSSRQMILRGTCEKCGAQLFRFSSDRQLRQWQETTLIQKQEMNLKGGADHCLNADKEGVTEDVQSNA